MKKYKNGEIVTGCVTGIEKYGIFVSLDDYYSGLIHISEISDNFVRNIGDYVKIGETIKARVIDENPEDERLQRQVTLLNKASICTIDSFCLDVVRNNFFEIDISQNFRIADTTEIEILQQDVLEELFEEKYEIKDENKRNKRVLLFCF